MDRDNFLVAVKESKVQVYSIKERSYRDLKFSAKLCKDEPMFSDVIKKEWVSGGTGGGSCYDEEDTDCHYSVRGEDEPDFVDLDMIVEKLCPDIKFLQYKKLIARLNINKDTYSINEYYGNSTNYTFKYLTLEEIYSSMNELGLI